MVSVWLKEFSKDKVQESVLERRCREAHKAVTAITVAPLTQPRQEEAPRTTADTTEIFEPEKD